MGLLVSSKIALLAASASGKVWFVVTRWQDKRVSSHQLSRRQEQSNQ